MYPKIAQQSDNYLARTQLLYSQMENQLSKGKLRRAVNRNEMEGRSGQDNGTSKRGNVKNKIQKGKRKYVSKL